MLNIENIKPFCLEDIFTIISILNKIDLNIESFKEKNEKEVGMEVIKQCVSKSVLAKENFYTLIYSVTGLTREECKKLNILELRQLGKKIIEINNISEVFTQVQGLI